MKLFKRGLKLTYKESIKLIGFLNYLSTELLWFEVESEVQQSQRDCLVRKLNEIGTELTKRLE